MLMISINFVKLELSVRSSQRKNFNDEIRSTYQYTKIDKVSLKFDKTNLELTEEFKNDMIDVINPKIQKILKKLLKNMNDLFQLKLFWEEGYILMMFKNH